MSELPPGFVIQPSAPAQPQPQAAGLPEGFEIQGAPAAEPHKFGLSDFHIAKLAKGIYDAAKSGLTLPGDVYAGNVPMWDESGHSSPELMRRAGELADFATPVGPAARLTKTVETAAKAPTQEALLHSADAGYKTARELGVELSPKAVADLGTTISSKLAEHGITGELAPKTFSLLKKIETAPEESVATVANMEALRRSFGHAAQDFANPTEQLAAQRAIDHIDHFMSEFPAGSVLKGDAATASKLLTEARGDYGAAKRSERITDTLENTDRNAAVANSGQNIGNANRQGFNSILKSDKKSSGFSTEELAKMDQVARGSPLGNATRVLGSLLGGGGGMGALHAAATGGMAGFAAGGFPGAAIGLTAPLVGSGLKKVSDATIKRGIKELDEMVRTRSPLAKAVAEAPELKNVLSGPRVATAVGTRVPLSTLMQVYSTQSE